MLNDKNLMYDPKFKDKLLQLKFIKFRGPVRKKFFQRTFFGNKWRKDGLKLQLQQKQGQMPYETTERDMLQYLEIRVLKFIRGTYIL